MLNTKKKGKLSTDSIHFFADEKEYPYSYPEDRPFMWTRGYHLGGRSLTWARVSLRWGPKDFQANAKDGYGVEWPIGYEDLAPWYDYVEKFAGIAGNKDGLADLPDGEFQKPWKKSCAEDFISTNLKNNLDNRQMIIARSANITESTPAQAELGRGPCQARSYCARGCTFGAYFSALSATLPAARNTGNLTIVTDSIVSAINYDETSGKASGVSVIDAKTKEKRSYKARIVFLCASTLGSVQILLNSANSKFTNGLGNSSNTLGRYLMDHYTGVTGGGTVPGFEDRYAFGRRPTGTYIPNYRHEKVGDVDFTRGFAFQGGGSQRTNTGTTAKRAGIGATVKSQARQLGPWRFFTAMFGEMLPYPNNVATLHTSRKDKWGIPLLHIDAQIRENERKMIVQAAKDLNEILVAGGVENIRISETPADKHIMVGGRTHEMGGAGMSNDPSKAMLNKWAQSHDVPNLFVTDGAAMNSCATQNPSLTYMAMTARSANYAADLLRSGKL